MTTLSPTLRAALDEELPGIHVAQMHNPIGVVHALFHPDGGAYAIPAEVADTVGDDQEKARKVAEQAVKGLLFDRKHQTPEAIAGSAEGLAALTTLGYFDDDLNEIAPFVIEERQNAVAAAKSR